MATLNGVSYSKKELLRYVGDVSQIARVKPYRLIEGLEDNLAAIDVSTGSGLSFTILPSRGMDISTAQYQGRSLSWRSATTDVHPSYFDHEGEGGRGWLRSFYGGLVVTCGLSYAGANGMDMGSAYGLHGRISNLPAYNVSYQSGWKEDDYYLAVTGKVREATVFGESLELTRTISTFLGSRTIHLHDRVENLGTKKSEHMILYHINLGFPVVSGSSRLISPTLKAEPRDNDAELDKERYNLFDDPISGYKEKVYFHTFPESRQVTVSLVNPALKIDGNMGFGVSCSYQPDQLPRFSEWKMMEAGTYVVGLEPANCLVRGRASEREAGTLQFLETGEVRDYEIDLSVVCGADEINKLDVAARHGS